MYAARPAYIDQSAYPPIMRKNFRRGCLARCRRAPVRVVYSIQLYRRSREPRLVRRSTAEKAYHRCGRLRRRCEPRATFRFVAGPFQRVLQFCSGPLGEFRPILPLRQRRCVLRWRPPTRRPLGGADVAAGPFRLSGFRGSPPDRIIDVIKKRKPNAQQLATLLWRSLL
jgi:hypothetical protein